MSTAVPVTTDTLPSNVPKLDIKGTNWAIFSLRFQVAVEAKELWKYFDGSCPRPASPVTDNGSPTPQLFAFAILSMSQPCGLRTKFLESKCLSAVGVDIEEKDYRSTIIQSLPNHLAIFASGQLATARLYSPTKTIDPDILISLIIEESERRTTRDARPPRNTRSGSADQALGVTDLAPRGRGGGRFRGRGSSSNRQGRPRPPCWNCGSRDHFKAAQQQTTTTKTMAYSSLSMPQTVTLCAHSLPSCPQNPLTMTRLNG